MSTEKGDAQDVQARLEAVLEKKPTKFEPQTGNPTEPGIYAIRQWYAWRILEWHAGAWWSPGRTAKWPLGNPPNTENSIEAFVGPLPVISCDFSVKPKGVMEFDL